MSHQLALALEVVEGTVHVALAVGDGRVAAAVVAGLGAERQVQVQRQFVVRPLLGQFRQRLADGETLDALGEGEVDLVQKTVDIELLAAPFQTVDTVVKNIPGVNYLMAGSLVAIPVSIKGPLDNPKVRVMSASSVGSSLLRLGERTIKSPLKLIEKFVPQGDGQNK